MEPTLVKVSGYSKYINIRTITHTRPSSCFAISRRDMLHLQSRRELIVQDGSSFAVLRKSKDGGTLTIAFSWLSASGNQLRGTQQTVELPCNTLMAYVKAEPSDQVLRFLSIEGSARYPRLVFRGNRLHEVATNKLVRRKFSKFLRCHFRWPCATEIMLYDDFVPYSFYFKEMCGDAEGICGGVILHGQEDMRTANYFIHT